MIGVCFPFNFRQTKKWRWNFTKWKLFVLESSNLQLPCTCMIEYVSQSCMMSFYGWLGWLGLLIDFSIISIPIDSFPLFKYLFYWLVANNKKILRWHISHQQHKFSDLMALSVILFTRRRLLIHSLISYDFELAYHIHRSIVH